MGRADSKGEDEGRGGCSGREGKQAGIGEGGGIVRINAMRGAVRVEVVAE